MAWLENKIAPPDVPANWKQDLLGVAMLAGLMAILLPGCWPRADTSETTQEIAQEIAGQRRLTDITGQMASPALLLAMGWLVAMRRGAIDLSVWVVAGVCGATAAAAMSAGVAPALAFAIAAGLGGTIGLINGLLVGLARAPSVAATLVVGLVTMWVAQGAFARSTVELPQGAFSGWLIVIQVPADPATDDDGSSQPSETVEKTSLPLILTRILIVLGLYVAVMFLAVRRGSAHPPGRGRAGLIWSLTVCGALAALGGTCLLMDHGQAYVPTRLIGDLRVPAAAILAGGLFFAGPHRAKLAGLCMPIALLGATIWRQQVWLLGTWGYEWQLLLLAGLIVIYHLASRSIFVWPGRPAVLAGCAAAAAAAGTFLLAATSTAAMADVRSPGRIVALAVCAAGGIVLLAGYRATGRMSAATGSRGDAGTHR